MPPMPTPKQHAAAYLCHGVVMRSITMALRPRNKPHLSVLDAGLSRIAVACRTRDPSGACPIWRGLVERCPGLGRNRS